MRKEDNSLDDEVELEEKFEKAEAMLDSLKNNLIEIKNLMEKVTCENNRFEIEHASLIRNFGNLGVVKKEIKGSDGTDKGNKIINIHEINFISLVLLRTYNILFSHCHSHFRIFAY